MSETTRGRRREPQTYRIGAGMAVARMMQTRRPEPPKPVVGPEAKPPTMPDGTCCCCRGKAPARESKEFRYKVRTARGKQLLIFLVCPACQRRLPDGHAAASEAVFKVVTADLPEKRMSPFGD